VLLPTETEPNVRLGGTADSGPSPVPVAVINCGLLLASSFKVITPLMPPTEFGLNVMSRTQLPEGAMLPAQLSLSAKSPLAVILLIASGKVGLEFVRTTLRGALVLPTALAGKLKLVRDRLTLCAVAVWPTVNNRDSSPMAMKFRKQSNVVGSGF
jgi:hypothetical protein